MGIGEKNPQVGVIVAVYYLGCSVGAVLFSWLADSYGRKVSLFTCLAIASIGNIIMFVSGLGFQQGALVVMYMGRIVMGLGVGGVDAVIPTYSSELCNDDSRGRALAQQFQANILGLNIAFGLNLAITRAFGKQSEISWRVPIIAMQVFPLILLALIGSLPESPRWFMSHGREKEAKQSLKAFLSDDEVEEECKNLKQAAESEHDDHIGYTDMLTPKHPQFHPTMLTILGQVNQMLTGYGAISVYGPQIFELLGFGTEKSEDLVMANYISYFLLMTFAWLLIDALGRRNLLIYGSITLTTCFLLLTIFSGLAYHSSDIKVPVQSVAIPGIVVLFIATGAFGIGWLVPPFLVPSEIYPTNCRAQGTAISVVVWGLSNFLITLVTPLLFNNAKYWIFLLFAGTNAFAGTWTYLYLPETGGRSFEDNQDFFKKAEESWRVSRVLEGEFRFLPYPKPEGQDGESQPLLRRIQDQVQS